MGCGSKGLKKALSPGPSPINGRGEQDKTKDTPLARLRERGGGEGDTLLDRAKTLRAEQTEAEQRLWYHLRANRLGGLKFKRQKPLGPYIVDIVCMEHALIVEADGGQHAENQAYDQKRDNWLREQGFRVLRFWNNEVLGETEAVLERILAAALSPNPSPINGRGEPNASADTPLARLRERGRGRGQP